MPRLKVRLIKPEISATVRAGDVFETRVFVAANGVEMGRAEISYDAQYLQPIDLPKRISLPGGTYQKTVSWFLKALAPVKKTEVAIVVDVRLVQAALFHVRIL